MCSFVPWPVSYNTFSSTPLPPSRDAPGQLLFHGRVLMPIISPDKGGDSLIETYAGGGGGSVSGNSVSGKAATQTQETASRMMPGHQINPPGTSIPSLRPAVCDRMCAFRGDLLTDNMGSVYLCLVSLAGTAVSSPHSIVLQNVSRNALLPASVKLRATLRIYLTPHREVKITCNQDGL